MPIQISDEKDEMDTLSEPISTKQLNITTSLKKNYISVQIQIIFFPQFDRIIIDYCN